MVYLLKISKLLVSLLRSVLESRFQRLKAYSAGVAVTLSMRPPRGRRGSTVGIGDAFSAQEAQELSAPQDTERHRERRL